MDRREFLNRLVLGTGSLTTSATFFERLAAQPAGRADYAFAGKYKMEDILRDPKIAEEFLSKFFYWGGKFHEAAIHPELGVTYDGIERDLWTGRLKGVRNWSAASKEAIHIAMLAIALKGDERAKTFVSPDAPAKAEKTALDILTKKIATYEQFNKDFPGYGGFLPWFKSVREAGRWKIVPTDDWKNRVPGLDPAEQWASMKYLIWVLKQKGHQELAARSLAYVKMMGKNSVMIFYDGNGGIRAEASIRNIKAQPRPENYFNVRPDYLLDDPYEGELMAVMIDLYGDLDAKQKDLIWERKRKKLVSVEYMTPKGPLTVERAWVGSNHEPWKFSLGMPYDKAPTAWALFLNGQKARSWDSSEKGIPGLFASTHRPQRTLVEDFDYISPLGVPFIASEANVRQDIVAPYAAGPMIRATATSGAVGIGASWLWIMAKASFVQTPFGTADGIFVDGTGIPGGILTWDGNIYHLAHILGGIDNTEALKEEGKLQAFIDRIEGEYKLAFPTIKGRDIPFAAPSTKAPAAKQPPTE
jgi:hypothetical protein